MSPVLRRLLVLINQFYCENHSVSFYAGKLGVSPDRLCRITRFELGIGVKTIIIGKIMERATALMKTKSGNEVAAVLGFRDTGYFSRFFKRYSRLA